MSEVKADIKGLEKLRKAIGKEFAVQVGILGNKTKRKKTEQTNAYIGFQHEFGVFSKRIPKRSFLKTPLEMHLNEFLEKHKKTSRKEFEKCVQSGDLESFARNLGIVAEEVIQEAFASRGFGQWKGNKEYTIRKKGSDSPLIDTGQLRRSITSRVKKK